MLKIFEALLLTSNLATKESTYKCFNDLIIEIVYVNTRLGFTINSSMTQ